METYRESFIKGIDEAKIYLRIWGNVTKPKGIIQIFHGMAEHSIRYNDFANFFNEKGYIVYANDHRGHGNTADAEKASGYLEENGFYNIVEDEKIISDLAKQEHSNLPLFIFAHSFGSFIGQEYIIRYSDNIDGIILSGSSKQDGLDVKAAYVLASIQNKFFDNTKEARLIDKLSFGSYGNRIKNKRTRFDWLSRDEKIVDDYINDQLCGYIAPIDFYYNMFKGFKKLYKPYRLNNILKTLPILIASGDMDPVGKYGNSVRRLYKQYKDLGIENVTLRLFKDHRHEIINEINREEVYDYIYSWIEMNNPKA